MVSIRHHFFHLLLHMANYTDLDEYFDGFLHQMVKGVSHEAYERGARYWEFEQVKEWKSKYGYRFSIYGNDHLIDGKPHFHFDNQQNEVSCKLGFDGELFECKGKNTIPANVLKELRYFLGKEKIQSTLVEFWNAKNPEIKVSL